MEYNNRYEILMPEKQLSAEFQAWIADDQKIKKLLEGSHVFTEPWDKKIAWEQWEKGRQFITSAIDKDGSLLDYGCANGFLLRSLQEWSEHKLDPYGFDIDQQSIKNAKMLFPNKIDHFVGPEELKNNEQFPKNFDFIYWNVWDNWKFEKQEELDLLKKLQESTNPGGRLILGLYDTREQNSKRIEHLKKLHITPSNTIQNPDGEEVIALFNR